MHPSKGCSGSPPITKKEATTGSTPREHNHYARSRNSISRKSSEDETNHRKLVLKSLKHSVEKAERKLVSSSSTGARSREKVTNGKSFYACYHPGKSAERRKCDTGTPKYITSVGSVELVGKKGSGRGKRLKSFWD